jgi:putative transposase
MASRRGRSHDCGPETLTLASCRPGQLCPRRYRPNAADTKAAKRLLKRLLKKQGCPPRRIVTDKLGSYAAARRQVMPDVEHRSHKGLNHRAENSHLPFRRGEQARQGFRSAGGLQRFVNVFSAVRNLFVPPRFRRSARAPHLHRLNAMATWKVAANVAALNCHAPNLPRYARG